MRDLQATVREVAVLQESTEMILSSMDADAVLHQILLIVRSYFGVSNCEVLMIDRAAGELYVRAQSGYDELQSKTRRIKVGEQGVTGYVASTKIPLYVPDVSQEPRYIAANTNIKSELALPLIVRDEVIGVLDLESDKVDYFSDEMIGLLALFAGQAAVALENARLYTSERRRMRQIEFINLIARSGTVANELDQLLSTFAELVNDTFEGSEVTILLRDRNGSLYVAAHSGGEQPDVRRFHGAEHNGILAETFKARSNVVANDAAIRQNYTLCLPHSASELCIPLLSFGETLGAIVISQTYANAFNQDDRSIAQAAGDVCATAIKNVQLSDELRRVANTDPLTGLYNQRYFHVVVGQELSRARRFGNTFSLLMFDLRNFRALNQRFTFDGGDEVLRNVGHAIAPAVRSIDTVCRYAADRFAIVLPEIERDVTTVQQKLAETLNTVASPSGAGPVRAVFASVSYPKDGATEIDLVRLLLMRIDDVKQNSASATA